MKSKSINPFWILFAIALMVLIFLIGQMGNQKENVLKQIDYNIIFIDIDVLRADHLGAYGYYRNTSPNIDTFARKGILFKNAYSQSGFTATNIISLLTSTLHPSFKIRNRPTLTSTLKENGYFTGIISGSLGETDEETITSDFDESLILGVIDRNMGRNASFNKTFGYGLNWIRKNINEKFFLYLHGYDLHTPYHSPYEDYFDSDYEEDTDYAYDLYSNHTYKQYIKKPSSNEREGHNFNDLTTLLKPEQINHIIAHYDGGILFVDELFGQFIDALNKTRLLNKTIIVVFSSHGTDLFENGRFEHSHWSMSYPVTHVPLVVHIPSGKHEVIDSPVSLIDVTPTILSLVGIKTKNEMGGINLVPIIENPLLGDKSRVILGDLYIMKENWKAILYPTIQLYNLKQDINESYNLANEYPEKVEELLNEHANSLIRFLSWKKWLKTKFNLGFSKRKDVDLLKNIVIPNSNDFELIKSPTNKDTGIFDLKTEKNNVSIKINYFKEIEKEASEEYKNYRLGMLNSVYEPIKSPYPGRITRERVCPEELKPVKVNTTDLNSAYYLMYSTSRQSYGACSWDTVEYSVIFLFRYCEDKKELYQVEIFVPINEFNKSYTKMAENIRCSV